MTGCSGDSTQAEGADSLIVGRRLTPAGTSQRRQAGKLSTRSARSRSSSHGVVLPEQSTIVPWTRPYRDIAPADADQGFSGITVFSDVLRLKKARPSVPFPIAGVWLRVP